MLNVFERALLIVTMLTITIAGACIIYMFFQFQIAIAEIGNTIEQFNQNGLWGK